MPPLDRACYSSEVLQKSLIRAYDALVLLCLALWLAGGIPWHGKTLLKHGADPRRAALIVGFLGLLSPALRQRSRVLAAARSAGLQLLEPRWRRRLLLGAMLWGSALGALQTLAFLVPSWDVGIFHQVVWSFLHGYGFWSSISLAGNFLMDHLAPSLALLAPVFALTGSSPLTLPMLTPFLLFGGAAAWVYLGARCPGASPRLRAHLAGATALFAVSFDSLWGNLKWGFHENAIAFAALSWAVALLLTRSPRCWLILLLLLVTAGSKEILLLDVAIALVVWAAFERKRSRAFAVFLVVAAVAMIGVFVQFSSLPKPADKNYFKKYYGYLGTDLRTFATTLLTSPMAVPRKLGWPELVGYLKTAFLPFLFLPLAWVGWRIRDARRGSADEPSDAARPDSRLPLALFLVIGPSFLSALVSLHWMLRSSGFHYVLEIWPVLAALTVVALGRIGSVRLAWIWALFVLLMMDQDPWNDLRGTWREARARSGVPALVAMIPPQDSVATHGLAGTWTASRYLVGNFPDLTFFPNQCPQWIFTVPSPPGPYDPELEKAFRRCTGGTRPFEPVARAADWALYQLK